MITLVRAHACNELRKYRQPSYEALSMCVCVCEPSNISGVMSAMVSKGRLRQFRNSGQVCEHRHQKP
eukprot:5146221-Alexandrium_andersonii.AAC.1